MIVDIFATENLLFMIPVATIIALIFAAYFFKDVWSKDKGTPEMQKVSDAIETGAMAYLKRQYKTIGIVIAILAVIIALCTFVGEPFSNYLNYKVAIAFVIGAAFSILSGFIGMKVSVNSNIRTSAAAKRSLGEAFKTSFRGGALSGIAVSALSLFGLFMVVLIYNALIGDGDGLTPSLTPTLRSVTTSQSRHPSERSHPRSTLSSDTHSEHHSQLSSPSWVEESTPKQQMSDPISSERSRPEFPRMTPGTLQSSQTLSETTSETVQVVEQISSSRPQQRSSVRWSSVQPLYPSPLTSVTTGFSFPLSSWHSDSSLPSSEGGR